MTGVMKFAWDAVSRFVPNLVFILSEAWNERSPNQTLNRIALTAMGMAVAGVFVVLAHALYIEPRHLMLVPPLALSGALATKWVADYVAGNATDNEPKL